MSVRQFIVGFAILLIGFTLVCVVIGWVTTPKVGMVVWSLILSIAVMVLGAVILSDKRP